MLLSFRVERPLDFQCFKISTAFHMLLTGAVLKKV